MKKAVVKMVRFLKPPVFNLSLLLIVSYEIISKHYDAMYLRSILQSNILRVFNYHGFKNSNESTLKISIFCSFSLGVQFVVDVFIQFQPTVLNLLTYRYLTILMPFCKKIEIFMDKR